jgi:hypothetical protein
MDCRVAEIWPSIPENCNLIFKGLHTGVAYPQNPDYIFGKSISNPMAVFLKSTVASVIVGLIFIRAINFRIGARFKDSFRDFQHYFGSILG